MGTAYYRCQAAIARAEHEIFSTKAMRCEAQEAIQRLEESLRGYYARPFAGDLSELSQVDGHAGTLEQLKRQYNEYAEMIRRESQHLAEAKAERDAIWPADVVDAILGGS